MCEYVVNSCFSAKYPIETLMVLASYTIFNVYECLNNLVLAHVFSSIFYDYFPCKLQQLKYS